MFPQSNSEKISFIYFGFAVDQELVSYECPSPMAGIHRCVFVFSSKGGAVLETPFARFNFSTRQFTERKGMGFPVAAVFFNTR
ncbi:hypothetical protein SUGI_0709200 [Cryptomeria japonica]|nr:hypothetical protein SUGI_0709200 [Cryptomeria japonica]